MKREANINSLVFLHFDKTCKNFDLIYDSSQGAISRAINIVFRRSMKLRYDKVLAEIVPYRGQNVLDVGCGSGRYCHALASMGVDVAYGIDFAPSMVELAREKALVLGVEANCNFQQANFIDIKINNKFNIVFSMGVMDYIEEPLPFLAILLDTAKKKVMVSFPAKGGMVQFLRKVIFKYIKNCPLYLYNHSDVVCLINKLNISNFSVIKMGKDYFLIINK